MNGPRKRGLASSLRERRGTIGLVAKRELRERTREKSFLISTGINVAIIVAVIALAAVLDGDGTTYKVAGDRAVVEAAAKAAQGTDVEVVPVSVDDVRAALEDSTIDAAVQDGRILAKDAPPDDLVALLQAGNLTRGSPPPPLQVSTVEPVDEDADAKAGYTFFIVLILYGQLLTYGYWVAAGVVEEKASRVVEVVLSTIRPAQLLAGKVIGLGLLGLGNLLLIFGVGLGVAKATGALDIDGAVLGAAALALAWFVVGYAFYACAFACAGALVSRQEDLQSTMTPLTVMILVSFFLAFAVRENPDGTLAHITAFIPMTAPLTVPPRIVTGDVPAWEIAASLLVTAGAAALLIPLAARIYSGGILRTGSALKLRDAWRAARA
ncbi:MAG TPA: ABC transporter permease [Solirubrobacteraceae bacterium]|nr:ABC transporter permease [Solirubrobacteraceae bacterium]